jgi:hypothetical protein
LFTVLVIPLGCISAEKRFVERGCGPLDERTGSGVLAENGKTT